MRRYISVSIVSITLLAGACGTGAPPVEQGLRGFDGELLDPDGVTTWTDETTTDAAGTPTVSPITPDEPTELAFNDGDDTTTGIDTSDLTKDDGVCEVLDVMFDEYFNQPAGGQNEFANDDLDNAALLQSLDDGPFGAEWNRFANVMFSTSETSEQDQAEFGPAWIIATDRLAREQCGFAAITTLMAAVSQDCFTKIETDGARGETTCTRKADPR